MYIRFFIRFLIIILFVSFGSSSLNAASGEYITRGDAFIFFSEQVKKDIPLSYLYIDVKYKNVDRYPQLKQALQILIYQDRIKNVPIQLSQDTLIDLATFQILTEKILGVSLGQEEDISSRKGVLIKKEELEYLKSLLADGLGYNTYFGKSYTPSFGVKQDIFYDIYTTLAKEHYNHESFERDTLLLGAIKGLTESTGDIYTTYFPPVESKNFFEGLEGEYEGIGAYVDMPEPGIMMIVTPIVGSPAEKSGIKGGDRITHVDSKEITSDNSLSEVVSWIKGPAGSSVKLKIFRATTKEELTFEVKREKIILKDVEYKILDRNTFYIQIKNFGEQVDTGILEALKELEKTNSRKLIIDLRNNPGGYLGKVNEILSRFIQDGEPVAIVQQGKQDIFYTASNKEKIDISGYTIILLQNSGTASASEIMIGTLKDYFPNIIILGEKSFGKGSVQSLKQYYDGSTLKYTTAKWFTGKSRTAIDGIGISPDIELIFDQELFEMSQIDNQLQKALSY